jgi:hypothetical protein
MVFSKPIGELGAPPPVSADYAQWASKHGGVEANPIGSFQCDRKVRGVQLE